MIKKTDDIDRRLTDINKRLSSIRDSIREITIAVEKMISYMEIGDDDER